MESGSFDIVCDLWRSTGDESGIVLEQIAGNHPDTILLLREGAKDVDKVSDILWCTRKVVKFLSSGFREIRLVLNEGGVKQEAYDSDLPLDSSVVVGGVAYRLENFIESGFGGSPGGHGCMERVKRD